MNTRTLVRAAVLVTGFAVASFAAPLAWAFQLLPLNMVFAPVGPEEIQTFAIYNDGPEAIAVQVTIAKREVALDGKETLTPAAEQFLVYPPNSVVRAGKVQMVEVRWLGPATPSGELSYRIIAEQLPVSLVEQPRDGGRLDILMRYEGSVYVVPQGAAPKVVVDAVSRVQTAEGPALAVTVRNAGNAGNAHGVLRDVALKPSVAGRPMAAPPTSSCVVRLSRISRRPMSWPARNGFSCCPGQPRRRRPDRLPDRRLRPLSDRCNVRSPFSSPFSPRRNWPPEAPVRSGCGSTTDPRTAAHGWSLVRSGCSCFGRWRRSAR